MPTTASSFAGSFGTVCRALILVALTASVVLVPSASAQSTLLPDVTVQAVGTTNLTGGAETSGGDPDGTGTAQVQIDVANSQVCATTNTQNLSTATAAHIHRGATGVNGGIVVNLPVPTTGSAFGCVTGVDATLLQDIVSNPAAFYVNVHNIDFSNSAIRGQLGAASVVTHLASPTGAAQIPPGSGDTDGTSLALFAIDVPGQTICIEELVRDIATPNMHHIHSGDANTNGEVVVNLPLPDNGAVVGCVSGIDATLIGQISTTPALFYDNVHNGDFPNGAIRGQLAALVASPAQSDVQLVSKVDSPDPVRVGQQLTYTLTVRNNGADSATGVSLIDVLPAGLTFVSATPNPACSQASGTVTCALGTLANGASTMVTIVATTTTAGTVNNSASVTSATADTNIGNNAAQSSTTVQTVVSCNPRPAVQVQAQVVSVSGVPRHRAMVTVQNSLQAPNNLPSSIQFTQLDGARVNVLPSGPNNETAAFSFTAPASTTQVQFDVFRTTPGASATVRFTAVDACGGWSSFVGAGELGGDLARLSGNVSGPPLRVVACDVCATVCSSGNHPAMCELTARRLTRGLR